MTTRYFKHSELGQLTRLCRIVRGLLMAFLLVQLGFFVLAWIIPMPLQVGPWHIQFNPDGMTVESVQSLSGLQRLLGIVIGLPGLVALTYGVGQLGQVLRHFQQRKIFAIETIAHLRSFAGALLFSTLAFITEIPVRAIAFNLVGAGQHYPVGIEITSHGLLLVLVCGLFYLVAEVMHEGRRLNEENEGFI